MATSPYIEVDIKLDSLDLIMIENLIEKRIADLKELKDGSWFADQLADEQIFNYEATLGRIKQARRKVKSIKAESDAQFYAKK